MVKMMTNLTLNFSHEVAQVLTCEELLDFYKTTAHNLKMIDIGLILVIVVILVYYEWDNFKEWSKKAKEGDL